METETKPEKYSRNDQKPGKHSSVMREDHLPLFFFFFFFWQWREVKKIINWTRKGVVVVVEVVRGSG
jgi:hypothetical protein